MVFLSSCGHLWKFLVKSLTPTTLEFGIRYLHECWHTAKCSGQLLFFSFFWGGIFGWWQWWSADINVSEDLMIIDEDWSWCWCNKNLYLPKYSQNNGLQSLIEVEFWLWSCLVYSIRSIKNYLPLLIFPWLGYFPIGKWSWSAFLFCFFVHIQALPINGIVSHISIISWASRCQSIRMLTGNVNASINPSG